MKPKIIGLILNAFNKAYELGACDDLTKEQEAEVLELLESAYAILANMKELTLTTELASIYLNVTRQTIHNYIKADKLHPIKLRGGVLLFSKKELDKLINKNN